MFTVQTNEEKGAILPLRITLYLIIWHSVFESKGENATFARGVVIPAALV
jgi:hypothetical protein